MAAPYLRLDAAPAGAAPAGILKADGRGRRWPRCRAALRHALLLVPFACAAAVVCAGAFPVDALHANEPDGRAEAQTVLGMSAASPPSHETCEQRETVGPEDLWYVNWFGHCVWLGINLFIVIFIVSCLTTEVCTQAVNDSPDIPKNEIAERMGKVLLGVSCLVLLTTFGPLLWAVLCFPVLSRLRWNHLERAIWLCLRVPGGATVGFSEYVLPLFAVFLACRAYLTTYARKRASGAVGNLSMTFLKTTVLREWVACKVFDTYGDLCTWIMMQGLVPGWFAGLWIATVAVGAALPVAAVKGQATLPQAQLCQLLLEDCPQTAMAGLLLWAFEAGASEYAVYSLLSSLFHAAELGRKWLS